jgi:hypothetical protein
MEEPILAADEVALTLHRHVNLKQLQACKALITQWDSKVSRVLTASTWSMTDTVLSELVLKLTQATASVNRQWLRYTAILVKHVFRAFARAEDSAINSFELLSALTLLCAGSLSAKAAFLFDLYDADSKGYLTEDELCQLIQNSSTAMANLKLGTALLPDDCAYLARFALTDAHSNMQESITVDSFCTWITTSRAPKQLLCTLSDIQQFSRFIDAAKIMADKLIIAAYEAYRLKDRENMLLHAAAVCDVDFSITMNPSVIAVSQAAVSIALQCSHTTDLVLRVQSIASDNSCDTVQVIAVHCSATAAIDVVQINDLKQSTVYRVTVLWRTDYDLVQLQQQQHQQQQPCTHFRTLPDSYHHYQQQQQQSSSNSSNAAATDSCSNHAMALTFVAYEQLLSCGADVNSNDIQQLNTAYSTEHTSAGTTSACAYVVHLQQRWYAPDVIHKCIQIITSADSVQSDVTDDDTIMHSMYIAEALSQVKALLRATAQSFVNRMYSSSSCGNDSATAIAPVHVYIHDDSSTIYNSSSQFWWGYNLLDNATANHDATLSDSIDTNNNSISPGIHSAMTELLQECYANYITPIQQHVWTHYTADNSTNANTTADCTVRYVSLSNNSTVLVHVTMPLPDGLFSAVSDSAATELQQHTTLVVNAVNSIHKNFCASTQQQQHHCKTIVIVLTVPTQHNIEGSYTKQYKDALAASLLEWQQQQKQQQLQQQCQLVLITTDTMYDTSDVSINDTTIQESVLTLNTDSTTAGNTDDTSIKSISAADVIIGMTSSAATMQPSQIKHIHFSQTAVAAAAEAAATSHSEPTTSKSDNTVDTTISKTHSNAQLLYNVSDEVMHNRAYAATLHLPLYDSKLNSNRMSDSSLTVHTTQQHTKAILTPAVTVGPIITSVTDSSAVVLLEFDRTAIITVQCIDVMNTAYTVAATAHVTAHRPHAFDITGLQQSIHYIIAAYISTTTGKQFIADSDNSTVLGSIRTPSEANNSISSIWTVSDISTVSINTLQGVATNLTCSKPTASSVQYIGSQLNIKIVMQAMHSMLRRCTNDKHNCSDSISTLYDDMCEIIRSAYRCAWSHRAQAVRHLLAHSHSVFSLRGTFAALIAAINDVLGTDIEQAVATNQHDDSMTHACSTVIAAVRDTTAQYECSAEPLSYSYTVKCVDNNSYSSLQQVQLNASTAILQIQSHNASLQLSPADWTMLYNMLLHTDSNLRNLLIVSDVPIVYAADNGVSRYNTSATSYSLLELLFDWLRQVKTAATSSSSDSTEQKRSLLLLCGAGSTSSNSNAVYGTMRIHDNCNRISSDHVAAAAAAAAAAVCTQWSVGSESATAAASTTANNHHGNTLTDTGLSTSSGLIGTRFSYHHDSQANSKSAQCSIALVQFDENTTLKEVHNSSFNKPSTDSGCVTVTPINDAVTNCTLGTVGPIIGYTTATTARVLIETSAACILTCTATPLSAVKAVDGSIQYDSTADKVTQTVHVVQGNVPVVFGLTQLKPCTRYSISFGGLANEHVYTASVLTSCSTPYSVNIAVTWSINSSTIDNENGMILSGWPSLLQQSALPNRNFDMLVNLAHICVSASISTQDHGTKAMFIADGLHCATDSQQELLQYSTEIDGAVATAREHDCQQAVRDVYRKFVSDTAYKQAMMSHTPHMLALSIDSSFNTNGETQADSEKQQLLSTLQRIASKEYQQALLHQQLQQQHSTEIVNSNSTEPNTELASEVVKDSNTGKAKSDSGVYIHDNTAVVVLDVYSNQTTATTDGTFDKQSELQPLLNKKQQKMLKHTLSLGHITALVVCCAVPFVGNVILHPQLPPMSEKEIKKSRKIMKERMIELERLAFTAANSAHTITTTTAAAASVTDDVSTDITNDNDGDVVAVEATVTIADNSTQPATIVLDEALQIEYTKLTLLDKEQKRQLKSTGRYRPHTEMLSLAAVGLFDTFHCEQRPQYQWGYHSIELAALLEKLFDWQHTAQGRSVRLVCGGTYGTTNTTITDIDSGSCIQQTCIGTISATGISEERASAVCNWSTSGSISDRLTYVHHHYNTDMSTDSSITSVNATYGVITVATEPHCSIVNSHIQHCATTAGTATKDCDTVINNNTVALTAQKAATTATTTVVSQCSAILGPVIGRIEVMPVMNDGKESRYSCRVPLLLEIDKLAIITCKVTDVLTAEVFKLSMKLQEYTARVFWMQGLRLSRRYIITFEGISNSSERQGILHTPSNSTTCSNSGSGSSTAATDTTDSCDDMNIVFVSGDNPGNTSLYDSSSTTNDSTTLWQSLAQQLVQPWHSISCIVHIGGQLNLDTAYSDSIALMKHITAQKQAGTLQLNGEKSALKAVRARFKSEYRAVWNVPSKQRVLATCSNIMLPSQLDVQYSDAIQQQLIACVYGKWIQRVAESVCKEYQRQLWDMHWGMSITANTSANTTMISTISAEVSSNSGDTSSDKQITDDILKHAAVFQQGRICLLHLDDVLYLAQHCATDHSIIPDNDNNGAADNSKDRSNTVNIFSTVLDAITARGTVALVVITEQPLVWQSTTTNEIIKAYSSTSATATVHSRSQHWHHSPPLQQQILTMLFLWKQACEGRDVTLITGSGANTTDCMHASNTIIKHVARSTVEVAATAAITADTDTSNSTNDDSAVQTQTVTTTTVINQLTTGSITCAIPLTVEEMVTPTNGTIVLHDSDTSIVYTHMPLHADSCKNSYSVVSATVDADTEGAIAYTTTEHIYRASDSSSSAYDIAVAYSNAPEFWYKHCVGHANNSSDSTSKSKLKQQHHQQQQLLHADVYSKALDMPDVVAAEAWINSNEAFAAIVQDAYYTLHIADAARPVTLRTIVNLSKPAVLRYHVKHAILAVYSKLPLDIQQQLAYVHDTLISDFILPGTLQKVDESAVNECDKFVTLCKAVMIECIHLRIAAIWDQELQEVAVTRAYTEYQAEQQAVAARAAQVQADQQEAEAAAAALATAHVNDTELYQRLLVEKRTQEADQRRLDKISAAIQEEHRLAEAVKLEQQRLLDIERFAAEAAAAAKQEQDELNILADTDPTEYDRRIQLWLQRQVAAQAAGNSSSSSAATADASGTAVTAAGNTTGGVSTMSNLERRLKLAKERKEYRYATKHALSSQTTTAAT